MAIPKMFSLYFCALIGFSIIGLGFAVRSPKIDSPHLEHILESGDNYTIFCEGNAPLRWTFPKVDSEYKNYTQIHHNEASPRNASYIYASELHITNITFPFVGFYNCHEQGRGRPSRIYLYVHDEYHLSVSELELETLLVTQRSDANIACRPTSPDVEVTLTTITNEQAENVTYDTKTGFKFFVNELSQSGEYICKFTRQKQEFEIVYFVVVIITDSLAIPFISEQEKKLHNVVGDTIKLKCMIRTQVHTYVTWETPTGRMDERYTETSLSQEKNSSDLYYKTLTITNATLQDKGIYWCKAKDNQNHTSEISINITIYDKDDHFIRLKEENDYEQITREAGTPSVQWNINIDALPDATVNWLNNRNDIIQAGITTKYETNITNTNAFLMIKDITISDFGNYTLVAENYFETVKLVLFLNVTAKPSVEVTTEQEYQMLNDFRIVTCTVAAYPEPLIYWEYKPCLDNSCNYKELKIDSYDRKGLNWISNINQTFSQSGTIRCFANNSKGDDMKEMDLYVSDVENGFDIYGLDEDVLYIKAKNKAIVAIGDSISVSCGAYVQNFSQTVKWMRDSEDVVSNDKYHIETSYTQFSNRTMLTIKDMNIYDQGIYNCVLYNTDDDKKRPVKEKTIEFHVEESMAPTLNATNLNDTVEWNVGDKLELVCDFEGLPKPSITWYKDNEIFWPHEVRTAIDDKNKKITFTYTKLQDEGTYKCEGRNSVGTKSKEMVLSFKMNRYGTIWYILAIIVLIVMVFLAVLIIYAKDRRKRKLEKVLKEAGLENFERGQLENLNPELGIDDQAELLPYDKKWEFPIHNLKMGKQLGAGAFGVVMKAEARGILLDEEKTIVAVKMVKQNAEHTYVKALASELKIMVHLGKHLNVVNLLGACTKNVAKRELYVIVEYCRFGNLHNYLYRHRDNFINQVDPQTGHIDFNIGLDILERTYSLASSKSFSPMKYAAMSFRSNSNKSFNSENRRESDPCNTARTESTFVSMSPNTDQVTGDDGMILSNSSTVQPEWRSNYRGDYKGNVRPIATKDLLAWAFQVARGMEYLASRKVLHGDLAARNILLADDNVVKICDFGLAKSMYKNDNYKKNSEGPLPIKWMAIESIRDRVFSTQSDVWSFGIVLWEFFSLARTPYPGMEAGERLYAKLVDGYRMETPEFATNDTYRMMLDCWSSKPLCRPSFTKLAERIGYMLEDSVRKHYIDLNDPYLVMNTQRLEDGGSDYLAMVSPPNFENLSSPQHYVNELPKSPGYMSMDTPGIFSPRTDEEAIFTFENKKKNGVSSKGDRVEDLPELAPMLGEVTPVCTSPTTPFSFSNPSYQMPPIIKDGCVKTDKDIVKSSDNYVNMPQNKNVVKEKTNSCAHIKVDEDTKDVHYVNSNSRDWETVIV